jgi:hypothetical protein
LKHVMVIIKQNLTTFSKTLNQQFTTLFRKKTTQRRRQQRF